MHAVRIEDRLWEALKRRAHDEDRSVNWLVNSLLLAAFATPAGPAQTIRAEIQQQEMDEPPAPAAVRSPIKPKPTLPGKIELEEPRYKSREQVQAEQKGRDYLLRGFGKKRE